MPTLDSYLFFNGRCREAMQFYEKTLGGKMEGLVTYADSPDPEHCSPGNEALVMHASLLLADGRRLMASDSPPEHYKPMAGFSLALNYEKAAEAKKIFEVLSAGGSVFMPMAETFWTETFGMCTDRFGTPWMVGGGPKTPA